MRLLVLLVAVSVCHLACVSAWSGQEQDLIAATATTDVEPSFMEVANIKYPREQKICCNLGSDTEKKFCRDQRTLPANMTYWSLCVGATGFECLGVEKMINIFKVIKLPVTIVKMWPYDPKRFSPHGVVKPQPEKNMVGLFASVGAIMHDRCCTVHNDGAFCNDKNNPIPATVNVNFGKYDNNCACLLEWRRAVFDLFHQYGERMNFPKTPQMNRNTVHKDKSRKSTLPGKLTVLNGLMGSDWTKFYDQDIAETEGTLAITFSPGSKLLCVAAADPHCKVPEKVACNKATKATDKKCKAELKPAQETAGDASYCRSKKFKKVVYKTDNVGYGICA